MSFSFNATAEALARSGEDPLMEAYRARTPKSLASSERAEKVMPGGETRAGTYHAPYSVTIDHASGAHLYDIDGNEYFDLINNYTVLVHGHAYPPVVEAIREQAGKGTTWAARSENQIELAEIIVDRVPSVEQVRFTSSGTEGVLAAIGVARTVTGRRRVLAARFSYHGYILESHTFDSKPDWLDTCLGDFGDAESFERILAEQGNEIACVILEPVLGAGGIVAAPKEFFDRVHAAARKAGALFIVDEATVFRVSTGGAQKIIGIDPDLTVLGKVIGGGTPAGAVGGKEEYMRVLDPRRGQLLISGTFSGNPVTMAAGIPFLRDLTQDKIDVLTERLARIEVALHASAKRHGLPFSTRRFHSLMNLYFQPEVPNYNQTRQDERLATAFQLACMNNGLFMVVRLVLNCSTVMTDADEAEILQRFDAAMADVAKIA
jgi:glutamate-1-semialdehyde 2,1-aminomutase